MSALVLAAVVTALAFGAAGLLASLLAAAAWRCAALRARLLLNSDALLAVRLLPGLAALGFALLLALPAFIAFEPADAGETPGLSLLLLAGALAAPAAFGARRAWRATSASIALRRRLLSDARPAALADSLAPAHETRAASPSVAVIGVWRPRLLISGRVRRLLTRGELLAVVAHENAHVLRRDNLRQWLMRAAPDWLGARGPARELESAWAESAERDADARAARRGPEAALALASALVAVARLSVEPPPPALGVSALHSGSAEALRQRVLRLTEGGGAAEPRHRLPVWASLAAAAALAPLAPPVLLARVHAVIETLVRSLP